MRRARAYTMTELVITSGLLLILLMVVAPIFASARASARQSECRSHVSVLCQHLTIYVADYDERFLPPPATGRRDWRPLLEPYFHGRELIAGCPSARPAGAGWATGYAYNDLLVDPGDPRQGMGFGSGPPSPTLVVLWCTGDGRAAGVGAGGLGNAPACEPSWRARHRGRRLAVTMDGHAKALRDEELDARTHPEWWYPRDAIPSPAHTAPAPTPAAVQ